MNVLEKFKNIKCFVFDVDGVLSDGSLLILPGGEFVRRMNIKDGYALQYAIKSGYKIAVITGSYSDAVVARLSHLGIRDVFQRESDKKARLEFYMNQHQLQKEEILYMGDDIPDITVMQFAGLACCPSDAVNDVKEISAYISPFKGGEGCVRDVIEKVLRLNSQWALDGSVRSI
ncbi:MAG: 3-deoxy-D-manno-octulosonate 8-phosphate phosphatase [Bacteroidetes bacterium]|nr:MAG: 3-deoxy-D-manno-octulosonate 8-phosphate phosphatase [Bacteroidota bacterium]